MLDYLEGDHSIEEFLDDFPTVQRDQAIAILKEFGHVLLTQSA